MPGSKDYCRILGVSRDASESEIKRAYRRAAGKYHSDKKDKRKKREAEEKFKEIAEAYEILSNPQKKAQAEERDRRSSDRDRGRSDRDRRGDRDRGHDRDRDWAASISRFYVFRPPLCMYNETDIQCKNKKKNNNNNDHNKKAEEKKEKKTKDGEKNPSLLMTFQPSKVKGRLGDLRYSPNYLVNLLPLR